MRKLVEQLKETIEEVERVIEILTQHGVPEAEFEDTGSSDWCSPGKTSGILYICFQMFGGPRDLFLELKLHNAARSIEFQKCGNGRWRFDADKDDAKRLLEPREVDDDDELWSQIEQLRTFRASLPAPDLEHGFYSPPLAYQVISEIIGYYAKIPADPPFVPRTTP